MIKKYVFKLFGLLTLFKLEVIVEDVDKKNVVEPLETEVTQSDYDEVFLNVLNMFNPEYVQEIRNAQEFERIKRQTEGSELNGKN